MLKQPEFELRYPNFKGTAPVLFEMFRKDAILIMGADESRWLGWYDQAMASLVAHLIFKNESATDDDSGLPSAPVVRTDVDDVEVEFANVWNKVPYVEADLYSTAYGQDYVRWRRMAFAGPRIA